MLWLEENLLANGKFGSCCCNELDEKTQENVLSQLLVDMALNQAYLIVISFMHNILSNQGRKQKFLKRSGHAKEFFPLKYIFLVGTKQ